jgi:outer membrane receptor protein involved in Fe transport
VTHAAEEDRNELQRCLASIVLALATTMLSAAAWAGETIAGKRVAFDIPRQRADQALIEFAEQADVTFMFPYEVSRDRTTNQVVGVYAVAEAITLLLRDTGLHAEFGVDGALTVSKGSSAPAYRRADHATRDDTMGASKQRISFLARVTGAVGSLFSLGAAAQVADNETTRVEPTTVEEVVVASSRITREGFNAPTPTTILGAEELQNSAVVNVADLLNESPAFSGSVTPSTTVVNSQNAGGNFLNLRGLGSARTLVLLNGRRHVPTRVTGSEVDINVIPSALLERVEVVTGGASAAWGSDAVAGVVNLVLRTDLDGFEGKLQSGISEQGDNEETLGTLAFGTGFAGGRGHFTAAAEMSRSEGVSPQTSRDWATGAWGIVANPAYAPGNGQYRQLIVSGYGMSNGALGGLIVNGPLRGTQFGAGGEPIPYNYGSYVGSQYMAGGDAVWLGQNIAIKIPVDRDNVFSSAHFDLTDNLRVFAEASYATSTTESDLVPTYSLGATTIYRDNAFLPQSIRDRMAPENLNLTSFLLGRFDYDLPLITTDIETTTRRGVLGLQGSLGEWKWELGYQYGKSRYDSKLHGNRIRTNYALATDAVFDPVTGRIVCRSTLTDPTNGCQPMNVFGVGSPSPQSIAYTTATQWLDAYYTQRAVDFSAQGPLFNTWAGEVSAAFGAGYRKEELSSAVDALSASNAFLIGNPKANSGSFDVKEAFAEVVVPLLSGRAWSESLEFNGAVRHTDYNLSGKVTTWKGGLSWQINDQVRLRGTRSRDIRAPNLAELYTPYQLSLGNIIDPATNVQANTYFITTGNPNLDPEEADTTTFGIVYEPSWASGLRTSVDFYDIKVAGAISTISGQNIVNRCYSGAAHLCALITRDVSSGVITQVALSAVNLSELTTRGVDIELSYDLPLSVGKLGMRLLSTYVDELATSDGITTIDRAGDVGAGHGGVPHWKAQASLTYTLDPITANVEGRYIGGGKYDNTFGPYDINDNTIGSVFYLDTALRYALDADGRMEVYGRIQNLLDKDPPINVYNFSQSMATNFALYDVIGRSYVAGVRFKF